MDIKILEGEDWEGMYIDDKLVYQGCEVEIESILTVISEYLEEKDLTKKDFSFEYFDAYVYLKNNAQLPEEFSEELIDVINI